MAYSDYAKKFNDYLTNFTNFISGKESTISIDTKIDMSEELKAIGNISTANQLIDISNAIYDQLAFQRTMKEIYKKPYEYFSEHKTMLETYSNKLNVCNDTLSKHTDNLNITRSNNLKTISTKLHSKLLKLANIKL